MAFEVTHFKLTSLPDVNAVESLINSVPVVVDTLYPIANQNLLTFEKLTAFDNLALQLPLTYIVHNDEFLVDSNSALMNLNWEGIADSPLSSNATKTILNDDVLNLLEELPLNDVVEFIEVTALAGINHLTKNGVPVYVGQRLSVLDMYYSIFTAGSIGGGDPYFQLSYKVGRNNILEVTEYTLDLDILAENAILTYTSGPTESNYTDDFGGNIYDVTEENTYLQISNSLASGIANAIPPCCRSVWAVSLKVCSLL